MQRASEAIPARGNTSSPTVSSPGCSLALRAPGASLKATQMVVQWLDISEDTHGVRLVAHHHHVLDLDEALAVGQVPETQKPHQNDGAPDQPTPHCNNAIATANGSQTYATYLQFK